MVGIAGIIRPEDQCAEEQEFSDEESVGEGDIMSVQDLKKRCPIQERENGSREKKEHEKKKQQSLLSLIVIELPPLPRTEGKGNMQQQDSSRQKEAPPSLSASFCDLEAGRRDSVSPILVP